jgi:hypothetical protein
VQAALHGRRKAELITPWTHLPTICAPERKRRPKPDELQALLERINHNLAYLSFSRSP